MDKAVAIPNFETGAKEDKTKGWDRPPLHHPALLASIVS